MPNTLPLATYTELDDSTVPPAQLVDIHGLITPTAFGPTDKPYLITTVDSFNTMFGSNGAGSPYFAQIKRALARGTAFYIQRLTAPGATAATLVKGTAPSTNTFTANSVGSFANGNLGIQYVPLGSNPTCKLTVIYTPDTSLNEVWTAATWEALIPLVNAGSSWLTITQGTTQSEPAAITTTAFLTGGTDGSFASASTRTAAVEALLANFNDVINIATLGVMGAYTAGDANNLVTYCQGRGDVLGLFELDPSLSISAAESVASSLALPIGSSFIAVYWGSALSAWSPEDNAVIAGPILTDVMSVYSYSDTQAGNIYRAPAGATRGLIPNVQSFAFNLLAPARLADANILVASGVNIVGSHSSFGPVVWGANTMNQKGSALDAINVRRMMIYLHQALQPIFDGELFEPMDPQSWRNAYNQAKPILDALVADQALDAWTYTGDQTASSIQEAVYNQPDDLANGLYKVLINVVPIGFIQGISFIAEVNNLLSLFQSTVND